MRPDLRIVPATPRQPASGTSPDSFRRIHIPLIIDSCFCLAVFGSSAPLTPHPASNVIAKFEEHKYNEPLLLFGGPGFPGGESRAKG